MFTELAFTANVFLKILPHPPGFAICQRRSFGALFQRMQISAFFICDSAKDYHGRLSILGMMEQITSESFPFQHQEMTVVLRFVFTEQDRGPHELILRFIDGDGNSPLADGGPKIKFEVPSIPTERVYWTLNQCFQLVGVPFQSPGLYRFDLIVDGEQRAFAPLRVEKKIKASNR